METVEFLNVGDSRYFTGKAWVIESACQAMEGTDLERKLNTIFGGSEKTSYM